MSGDTGHCDGNIITDCTIRQNESRGIMASAASGNRVEGNHVSCRAGTVTCGIRFVSSTNNLILRNSRIGHLTNYTFSATDVYGPIVTNTGALATTGEGAHPWANFSR